MRIGGTELNALRTAERLDRSRFELTVVCLNEEGPLRQRYRDAGIEVETFPIRSLYGPSAAREGFRLGMYLRREGVQVVHTHDVYSNVFASVWARVFGVPVIIASRRWWKHVPRPALMMANRFAYAMSHRVLANSEAVAELLATAERIDPRRIVVVHNFVDEEMFAAAESTTRCTMRADLGCPDDALVVGSVSRLHPVKDLSSLLRATHTLVGRWPALRVVLIGDGEARRSLEEEAAALGIADRVTFAGMRPQQPNMHAAFDISVCCSLSEGFPNSVVEAMAAARPVVGTDVGGIPDAVRHGETGLLVPAGDVAALANAIEALLLDPSKRKRFGEAGREVARSRFSASSAIERLESTYEQLVREALGTDSARPAPGDRR